MQPPIVYVWLGSSLPKYAQYSLKLVDEYCGVPVIILGEGKKPKELPKTVEWVDIQTFYEPEEFQNFLIDTPLDPKFRNGFWLKVSERFFVLKQFQKLSGISNFFHAELDVLIFDISKLGTRLDSLGKGIFIPRDRTDRMIASLIYINEGKVLSDLCEFLLRESYKGIEMYILYDFLSANPLRVFTLPSVTSILEKEQVGWKTISDKSIGGVVDATDFGRYIFGLDKRNTNRIVRNHYLDELAGKDSFNSNFIPQPFPYTLSLEADLRTLTLLLPGGLSINIFAVHVHSKIFRKLARLSSLERIISRHNQGKPTTISHNINRRIISNLKKIKLLRIIKRKFLS